MSISLGGVVFLSVGTALSSCIVSEGICRLLEFRSKKIQTQYEETIEKLVEQLKSKHTNQDEVKKYAPYSYINPYSYRCNTKECAECPATEQEIVALHSATALSEDHIYGFEKTTFVKITVVMISVFAGLAFSAPIPVPLWAKMLITVFAGFYLGAIPALIPPLMRIRCCSSE